MAVGYDFFVIETCAKNLERKVLNLMSPQLEELNTAVFCSANRSFKHKTVEIKPRGFGSTELEKTVCLVQGY